MKDPGIGKIITGQQGRDAIHIAVAPVVAVERLSPGQHVGLVSGGVGACANPIGIVDPYLGGPVVPGEQFWMFLYPNTITSLRHEWTLPAIDGAATPAAESRAWIEAFAAELDQTYNRLMSAAELWVEQEDYTYDNTEAYKEVADEKWPIFWQHYEAVTGTKVKNHKATFFTCSC